MRKNKPSKSKTGLSASEQKTINSEFEKRTGTKLGNDNAQLDETSYDRWKKTGELNGLYYNPTPKPTRVDVGPLSTKKLTPTSPRATLQKQEKRKTVTAAEPKFKPAPGVKKLTRTGTATGNVVTAVKNVVNKAKFEREKKLSSAYKKATSTMGSDTGTRREELKDYKSGVKLAKKTGLLDKKTASSALKETRKATRFEKMKQKGKLKYFK